MEGQLQHRSQCHSGPEQMENQLLNSISSGYRTILPILLEANKRMTENQLKALIEKGKQPFEKSSPTVISVKIFEMILSRRILKVLKVLLQYKVIFIQA